LRHAPTQLAKPCFEARFMKQFGRRYDPQIHGKRLIMGGMGGGKLNSFCADEGDCGFDDPFPGDVKIRAPDRKTLAQNGITTVENTPNLLEWLRQKPGREDAYKNDDELRGMLLRVTKVKDGTDGSSSSDNIIHTCTICEVTVVKDGNVEQHISSTQIRSINPAWARNKKAEPIAGEDYTLRLWRQSIRGVKTKDAIMGPNASNRVRLGTDTKCYERWVR